MFNKILSTVAVAAMSAMVLVGVSGAAKAVTLVSPTYLLTTGGDVNYDVLGGAHSYGSNIDTVINAPEFSIGSNIASNLSFSHTWTFNNIDPANTKQYLVSYQVVKTGPISTNGEGIAALNFNWSQDGSSAIQYTDGFDGTVTDLNASYGAGHVFSAADNNVNLVGIGGPTEIWYYTSFFTGNATNTLTVSGTALGVGGGYSVTVSAVPLPPAALLFGTALFGIGALRRRKDKKAMDLAV